MQKLKGKHQVSFRKNFKKIAKSRNSRFKAIHPSLFNWIPISFYLEIQLSIQPFRLWRTLNRINPPQIHIATEGIMGLMARIWCEVHRKPFTSSYHTPFPEHLNVLFGLPLNWTYDYLRHFDALAKTTFVATESVREALNVRGFKHLTVLTRGVSEHLMSEVAQTLQGKKLKVLNVGRVSKEKIWMHFVLTSTSLTSRLLAMVLICKNSNKNTST